MGTRHHELTAAKRFRPQGDIRLMLEHRVAHVLCHGKAPLAQFPGHLEVAARIVRLREAQQYCKALSAVSHLLAELTSPVIDLYDFRGFLPLNHEQGWA